MIQIMDLTLLTKLNGLILYGLIAFFVSIFAYPRYIRFIRSMKWWKQIRDDDVTWKEAVIFHALHEHKSGTPTLGWWLLLVVVLFMVWLSYIPYHLDWINNTLFNRQETYILLFGFFSMGLIGLVDDIINIQWKNRVKWLSARWKMSGMILFASFITYWFYVQLGVDWLILRPGMKIDLWLWFIPFTFLFVLFVTHAINITDGLDGLAWWMLTMVFTILAIVTFFNQTYIATSLIVVVVAIIVSFLWYNISPAQIFMWDSGSFALWWLLSTLVLLLNMREGIMIPFFILFMLFIIELLTSFIQIISKKIRWKKVFPIAPFHHLREYYGHKEHTIVMKFWMIQWVLSLIAIMVLIYMEFFIIQ